MITIKQCNTCKQSLPRTREYFSLHNQQKDGFLGTCKPCRNAKRRAKRMKANTGLLISVEEAKQLQAARKEAKRQKREAIDARNLERAINGIKSHSQREQEYQQREYEEMAILFEPREDYRQDFKAMKRAIKRVNKASNTGGWRYIAYDLNKRGYRTSTGDLLTSNSIRRYAEKLGIKRKWK